MSSRQDLVAALLAAPTPRPDALAREAAGQLFPTWQAILVGVPFALIVGAMTGLLLSLLVALPVGHFVGKPLPAWVGRMSEILLFAGMALGAGLVFIWLRRRRASFAALVRDGTMFPTIDVGTSGLGGVLASKAGRAAAELALDALGGTLAQIYGAPIVGAEVDGSVVEVRTPGNWRGRFPRPSHMLVQPGNRYVALLGAAGLSPQRVLRRRPAKPAG